MMRELTRGEKLADEAWRVGDHRPRCTEGHLLCRGCQTCACTEALDGVGRNLSRSIRVTTDKAGRTWCQECRYEVTEYGNLRDGRDVDDGPSRRAWSLHRATMHRRQR